MPTPDLDDFCRSWETSVAPAGNSLLLPTSTGGSYKPAARRGAVPGKAYTLTFDHLSISDAQSLWAFVTSSLLCVPTPWTSPEDASPTDWQITSGKLDSTPSHKITITLARWEGAP